MICWISSKWCESLVLCSPGGTETIPVLTPFPLPITCKTDDILSVLANSATVMEGVLQMLFAAPVARDRWLRVESRSRSIA